MTLFTRAWWEAAGARVADTVLGTLLTLIVLLVGGDIAPSGVLSLVAVQAIVTFATAFAGLPEVAGKAVPLWRAIIVRTAKTTGQSLVTAFAGVELLEQVAWDDVWIVVAGATLYTLIRTLRDYLPETAPAPAILTSVDASGVATVTAVPGPSEVPPVLTVDDVGGDRPGPDHRA